MKYLNKDNKEVTLDEFRDLIRLDKSLFGVAYVQKNKKTTRVLDPTTIIIYKSEE